MKLKEDYIKYKLDKADESIKAAEVLLENRFYADAVSKLYDAVFHAVNALIINKDLNPKTHSGVKSIFHKEFIYTGIVDKQFAELYDSLLAKRFEADYESFAFIDEEKIPEQLSKAIELIVIVKEKISNK